jgi:metallo-beta-lactamase family protein
MKITFYGAARAVTGSCHCLDVAGVRILIDCGLQQGGDETDNSSLPFSPTDVDYVIVTHAHIDHTGRLPLMVKQGFKGHIITTRLTAELMSIMLRDSAHIQESDAEWENRKGKRAGRNMKEPLYTLQDAEKTMDCVWTCDYDKKTDVCEGVSLRFIDAGHLLGSAMAELWVKENGIERKLVFSGDIGNYKQPIIRDPQIIREADYVIMESTYGDRNHEGEGEYTENLARVLDDTFAKGGNVIIPSFAVGRTQELLYFIREIKEKGLVRSLPDFPVYVDSPLANEATKIFSGDLKGYIDEEAQALVKDGVSMFTFPNLRLCESTEESRSLNEDKSPKVIISASGMCDAGRIRHHLKHNLWRPECTVVFVGYQANGSLGRLLLDGAKRVKLFGEEIAVQASIVNFRGLSSHAGFDGLIDWIKAFNPKPKHVFVVHGEADVAVSFADTLKGMGFDAHAPEYLEVYDLVSCVLLQSGMTPEYKRRGKESTVYARLLNMGQQLLEVIKHNKGGANKDLARFADQIKALIDKWDR